MIIYLNMKIIILNIFFTLFVLNCMGQINFLNETKEIATFSTDKSFSKKYNKLMVNLLKDEPNNKKKNEVENKLITFFKNYLNNKSFEIREVANYQLGHYYAFGVFDPYFFDMKPSNINREILRPINKQLALSYLDKVKGPQGFLRLVPNTWLTNYEKGLGMASPECGFIVKEMANFILNQKKIDINFFNCGKYAMDYCDECISYYWDYPSLDAIINLLRILYELPQNHPLKTQLLPNISTDEIISLTLSFQKAGKKYETLYYGSLGAMRGDANCLIIVFDELSKSIINHYKIYHPAYEQTGYPYYVLSIKSFILGEYIKTISKNHDEILNKLSDYYSELGNEDYKNYTAEQKAKKIARRKAKWKNIGLALAQALSQIGSQYIAQNQHNLQQINSTELGNLNSFLDPRLAMRQVNNQYYKEYTQFCIYNKKPDGSSYTFDEWFTMRGQSEHNINNDSDYSKSSDLLHTHDFNKNTLTSRRCKKLSATDMAHCEGSGICQRCNGNKRYWDNSFGKGHWVDPCTTCGGTGKCPSCNGTVYR